MQRVKPLTIHQIPTDSFCPLIVILVVRTYAVWNKNKRVGIGLALLLGLCQIPNAIIAQKFLQGIECGYSLDFSSTPASGKISLLVVHNPYPEIYRGCAVIKATRLVFVNWVVFIMVEGGTPTTVWFKVFGSSVPYPRSCPLFDDR